MAGKTQNLLKLRGMIPSRINLILQVGGFFLFFLVWYVLTMGSNPVFPDTILPTPYDSFKAFFTLLHENDLVVHVLHSVGLNLGGYIEAIVLSILFGFVIGLFPLFRGLFQKQVDALRFVPLTAVTGIFIVWFGIGVAMKIHFLAFGIFIYLLPVVVQRIDEVSDVYTKTVYTLGANTWQTIKSVYIPFVMSKVVDDIRVLTAISWTYIIIAEVRGSDPGIGALMWRLGGRLGQVDKLFALLVIVIFIGVVQDQLFKMLDRHFFPHKYLISGEYGKTKQPSAIQVMLTYVWKTLFYVILAIALLLIINEYTGIITSEKIFAYYFGGTASIVIFSLIGLIVYQVYSLSKSLKK